MTKQANSTLNLRSYPSTDADVLAKIPNGTIVTVLDYDYDWCYINYNGKNGYVSSEFLGFLD